MCDSVHGNVGAKNHLQELKHGDEHVAGWADAHGLEAVGGVHDGVDDGVHDSEHGALATHAHGRAVCNVPAVLSLLKDTT